MTSINRLKASKLHATTMSNPPATSSFEHRVRAVAPLLETYIRHTRRLSDETSEELRNIQAETLRQAREDIIRQPRLQVPWSERLGAFSDNYGADVRATQDTLSTLICTWWMITIELPVFLLSNITLIRKGAWWATTLVWRWGRCLWTHNQLSMALLATLQDGARQQLPDLTNTEADSMVGKITLLALVAASLGVDNIERQVLGRRVSA